MEIKFNNYARKIGNRWIRDVNYTWYSWRVFVDASDDVLDTIEYVEYLLDPSFPSPNRRVDKRVPKFALESRGWGSFMMGITVRFKNGTEEKYSYYLDLSKPWPDEIK